MSPEIKINKKSGIHLQLITSRYENPNAFDEPSCNRIDHKITASSSREF